jgi:transposase-like protein
VAASAWLTDTSQLAARTRSVATRWQIKRRGELCNGRVVSDRSRTKHNMSCPRCGTAMNDVVRIEPTLHEPGLIAYECPRCVYVTSVLLEPTTSKGNPPIRKRVNARPLK